VYQPACRQAGVIRVQLSFAIFASFLPAGRQGEKM
jgi:hypothetical protein